MGFSRASTIPVFDDGRFDMSMGALERSPSMHWVLGVRDCKLMEPRLPDSYGW